ncbi:MAG: DUF262 domain-containing protein [Candidatus Riflebacteria bacterium]|nr:DUF262 domain-containing protein [Candidatus Riflebacteria bacterium]
MNNEEKFTDDQEIEGLGKDEDESLGDYPIDTLLIRSETRTVHDVIRRTDMGAFVMDPDFQRDFIWDNNKQSKLIESVLMRIPLPVLYLAEDEKGRMIVVDGLQRLTTFQRFVKNQLQLKLSNQPDLDKKFFRDLSPKLQNRVEDFNLILYIIDAKVPERARLDIFDRVNSGVPLSRQQMRNCLYNGQATRFLKNEAATELFIMATGGSLRTQSMRDREFVNRFCAFSLLSLDTYRNEMDEWLARALKQMNGMSQTELFKLSQSFQNSLINNYILFKEHAFRKHNPLQDRRSVLNASLWDIMTTGLSKYSQDQVQVHSDKLKKMFYAILDDERFIWSITYGPNSQDRVKYRFEAIRKILAEVFGDKSS